MTYLSLIKEELGHPWLNNDMFRFGASSLLGDIERQLEHHVTGPIQPPIDTHSLKKAEAMDIKKIMEKMDYGTAPEAVDEAQNWLLGHKNRFGHFIDGAFTEPEACFTTYNPADRSVLAEISQASESSLDKAVASAQSAFQSWSQEAPHKRAKSLYALARLLQKHSRLFATLETLDNGKPIRESRDIDIPLAQRHFYYHAGMAQLMPIEMPERMPLGICGQIIP